MPKRLLVLLAAAGPLLLPDGPRPAAARDAKGGDFIDAHVHVWTADTARYPLAPGFAKADMSPPSFTPAELFRHCKPAGVRRVNLVQMSFYGCDNSLPN
jgi:predicted TIM-barrel fold metal-dependent hydrolase